MEGQAAPCYSTDEPAASLPCSLWLEVHRDPARSVDGAWQVCHGLFLPGAREGSGSSNDRPGRYFIRGFWLSLGWLFAGRKSFLVVANSAWRYSVGNPGSNLLSLAPGAQAEVRAAVKSWFPQTMSPFMNIDS